MNRILEKKKRYTLLITFLLPGWRELYS